MADKKRVVVIDDEADIVQYIASILEEHGFETQTAEDASAGEILIRGAKPDLVCLDIMMPGRSGVQLLARLRADDETKGIPLIMITGIRDKMGVDWDDVADGLRTRKPDGVIEKPVDPVRLMRTVEKVLARS